MATVIRGSDNFDTAFGANVVQTHVTATSSQALAADTRVNITGLAATITPKYTTSKIMVEVRWCGEPSSAPHEILLGIRRGGVDIGNPPDTGARATAITSLAMGFYNLDSDSTMDNSFYTYLDSPNTTDAIVYTATVLPNASVTLYNNRTVTDSDVASYERLTSSITLTEVQG